MPASKKKAAKKKTLKKKAGKKAVTKKKVTRKKAAPSKRKAASSKSKALPGRRADFGAPIDTFFARQPPHLREILMALRKIVERAAPEATGSLKWGMPVYSLGTRMLCALAGHRAHVNLVLVGPGKIFADPKGLLGGGGKGSRRLRLESIDDLPPTDVKRWMDAAVRYGRSQQ